MAQRSRGFCSRSIHGYCLPAARPQDAARRADRRRQKSTYGRQLSQIITFWPFYRHETENYPKQRGWGHSEQNPGPVSAELRAERQNPTCRLFWHGSLHRRRWGVSTRPRGAAPVRLWAPASAWAARPPRSSPVSKWRPSFLQNGGWPQRPRASGVTMESWTRIHVTSPLHERAPPWRSAVLRKTGEENIIKIKHSENITETHFVWVKLRFCHLDGNRISEKYSFDILRFITFLCSFFVFCFNTFAHALIIILHFFCFFYKNIFLIAFPLRKTSIRWYLSVIFVCQNKVLSNFWKKFYFSC